MICSKYLTMICRKHINYVQVIPECLLILLCPEDRPHTALLGPQPVQIFLRQEQMVWTHLACHRQTLTHTKSNTAGRTINFIGYYKVENAVPSYQ